MSYVPRPGSKTEAAVNFLRTNGGQATAIDIAEAIDSERKNLHAILAAAMKAGLLERCTVDDWDGYRVRDAAKPREATAAAKPHNPTPLLGVGETSTRLAPAAGRAPLTETPKSVVTAKGRGAAKAKKPVAPRAAPAPKPAAAESKRAPFRCGFFNDGSLRVEGVEGDLTLIPHDNEAVMAFSLSPNAAAALTAYVKGMQP